MKLKMELQVACHIFNKLTAIEVHIHQRAICNPINLLNIFDKHITWSVYLVIGQSRSTER